MKADGPRPVTLDVNILVAAVVGGPGVYSSWPSPPPLRGNLAANCLGIVNDAQEFRLVLSDHVLRHTGRVLRRIGWEARPIADYLAVLQAIVRHGGGTVIQPQVIVTDCEDNEDNRVLELAAASRSVLIVSEDQHLLALSPWRGVPVLRAAEFASRVDVRRRARRPGSRPHSGRASEERRAGGTTGTTPSLRPLGTGLYTQKPDGRQESLSCVPAPDNPLFPEERVLHLNNGRDDTTSPWMSCEPGALSP